MIIIIIIVVIIIMVIIFKYTRFRSKLIYNTPFRMSHGDDGPGGPH